LGLKKDKRVAIAGVVILIIIVMILVRKRASPVSTSVENSVPEITTEVEIESSDGVKLPVYKSTEP
jgi:uncharacterized protein YpmB